MKNIATIKSYSGRRMTLELDQAPNSDYLRLIRGKRPYNVCELRYIDERKITQKQRSLIYSLMRDVALHTGYEPEEVKELFKYQYVINGGDYISFADCEKQQATEFIDMLLKYCIKEHIQLAERYQYLLEDTQYFYYCAKYRQCCVCGKPHADIHHAVGSVGMGRNRRYVDHSKYGLEALCREHHTECHQIGQTSFDRHYKLTPVYLTIDDIKRLKMANKQFLEDLQKHNQEIKERMEKNRYENV